jgi:hypothetical protein
VIDETFVENENEYSEKIIKELKEYFDNKK